MKQKFEIFIREVAHGTEDYLQTVELRNEVLRRPLGLELGVEEMAAEKGSFHLAGWLGGRVVACTILEPVTPESLRLRQFAVREGFRGMGVGGTLLDFAENFARDAGFVFITLHARETALPFYRKAGYLVSGERFVEVTLPHWAMGKKLTAT